MSPVFHITLSFPWTFNRLPLSVNYDHYHQNNEPPSQTQRPCLYHTQIQIYLPFGPKRESHVFREKPGKNKHVEEKPPWNLLLNFSMYYEQAKTRIQEYEQFSLSLFRHVCVSLSLSCFYQVKKNFSLCRCCSLCQRHFETNKDDIKLVNVFTLFLS